jgi:surface antigen
MEETMRPLIAVAGLILIGPGCVQAPLPPPEPVISQVRERVAADDPTCRDYTAQATVDGRQQEIVGRACQQSDGSWRIAEGPPGQPTQYQTIYGPPLSYAYGSSYPYPYYPYYDSRLWGPPIGLSFGSSFVFVDRFHHFHHFRHEFAHDGFRQHGFGHFGFGHGGFGHGGFGHGGFGRGGMGGMHHG